MYIYVYIHLYIHIHLHIHFYIHQYRFQRTYADSLLSQGNMIAAANAYTDVVAMNDADLDAQ